MLAGTVHAAPAAVAAPTVIPTVDAFGLGLDATQLCVIGGPPDGESFTACDRIRAQ